MVELDCFVDVTYTRIERKIDCQCCKAFFLGGGGDTLPPLMLTLNVVVS